jgi:flagellar motor switch protein FliN/FliY
VTSEIPKPWLPRNALEQGFARSVLADAVQAWSKEWFARETVRLDALTGFRGAPPPGPRCGQWRAQGALAICSNPAARTKLCALALGLGEPTQHLSPRESAILDALEQRMIDSLIERLITALAGGRSGVSGPAPAPRDGGVMATLAANDGAALFAIAIPFELMLAGAKMALSAQRRARAPLSAPGGRLRALAPTALRLEADLGAARLSVGELKDLEPGDVLTLDRAIVEGATLTLHERALARGHLIERDGALALSLE